MDLGIYEALTEIGVKADSARVVERKFEAAIDHRFEPAKADLMTKADGQRIEASIKTLEASLKAELRSAMLDQLKWTVGLMFTFSGVIIAAIKLL
ncbi:MAG: hypothetical protein ORN29_10205 [Rhodoferax sp.]|nr:hypothetical protein [Rhodoferax sp.]